MHVERGENKQRMRVCSAQTANAGDQSKELKNVMTREEKRRGLVLKKKRIEGCVMMMEGTVIK